MKHGGSFELGLCIVYPYRIRKHAISTKNLQRKIAKRHTITIRTTHKHNVTVTLYFNLTLTLLYYPTPIALPVFVLFAPDSRVDVVGHGVKKNAKVIGNIRSCGRNVSYLDSFFRPIVCLLFRFFSFTLLM